MARHTHGKGLANTCHGCASTGVELNAEGAKNEPPCRRKLYTRGGAADLVAVRQRRVSKRPIKGRRLADVPCGGREVRTHGRARARARGVQQPRVRSVVCH